MSKKMIDTKHQYEKEIELIRKISDALFNCDLDSDFHDILEREFAELLKCMPDDYAVHVADFEVAIVIDWECPVCDCSRNKYRGNREDTNFFDACDECGFSVEILVK